MKKISIVIMLVFLTACAAENEAPERYGDEAASTPSLATDYDFEPFPGSQWYGSDGEKLPEGSRVINAITGPDHCDWEAGVMMHLGWPLGRDASDISQARQYLRDPEKVFPQDSLMSTFDGDATLPSTAEPTGYRTDFMELWLDPDDGTAVYLVFADHVERWPRAGEVIACA